jgi:hypothetical protein
VFTPALMLAIAAFSGPPPHRTLLPSHAVLIASSPHASDSSGAVQATGRYKKQGANCVWDANDGGPNQCTPQTKGRFKKGGNDSCTWDADDVGADQCRPAKGRWKKGGNNSCAWDANDGGPDQCNPRHAK